MSKSLGILQKRSHFAAGARKHAPGSFSAVVFLRDSGSGAITNGANSRISGMIEARYGKIDEIACQKRRTSQSQRWYSKARDGERICQARLRVSARAAIATSARRASLTDFESGNASVSSASIRTTLVPRSYFSAYLPRTPPEKS